MSTPETGPPPNFIRTAIEEDTRAGRWGGRVVTRFPPEPNGYLHIGHAKAICLDFGLAREFGGSCHLRFDDTNPAKEEVEYVDAIQEDVRWLGFDWERPSLLRVRLLRAALPVGRGADPRGQAYVDDLSAEEIREYRGTLTAPGRNSPYRDRSVDENLDLFRRMRAGEFPDGARVLRAKIDMASPEPEPARPDPLPDPARRRTTGPVTRWCIYPMYDYAHPLSDSIERVTHSLCTPRVRGPPAALRLAVRGARTSTTRSRSSSRG